MIEHKHKLTLDRPATYHIRVPGEFDEAFSDWFENVIITVEKEIDRLSITTIACTVDQAALQGLLRRLYSLGLPLISVKCVESDSGV